MNVIRHIPIFHRLALASVSALAVGALLLTAAPAFALRGHKFEKSFGHPGGGNGELEQPWDAAVNEATGDIYIVDHGNNRVEVFNEREEYVSQFNGSGELAGEDKAAGSGSLKTANGASGEVESGRFEGPTQIAVDNSCHYRGLTGKACEEYDPSDGDVYVIDSGHLVVDKYTASGGYVGQITESASGGRFEKQLDGVAVGKDGTVYVAALYHGDATERGVFLYSNAVPNGTCTSCGLSNFEVSGGAGGFFGFLGEGLAVNGQGDVYVQLVHFDEPNAVAEYSPSGEGVGSIEEPGAIGEGVPSGVAVELPGEDVYVVAGGSVGLFGSSDGLVERFGVVGLDGSGVGVAGVSAVAGVAGDVFVPDVGGGFVDVFGLEPPGPPTIENESVSGVTSDSALVDGELNPRGAATGYRVEYWACASYGSCGAGREGSAPAVEAVTGADFEVHRLGIAVQGLLPATAYHFRLVARNRAEGEENIVEGEEGTFVTQHEGGELVLPDGREWELVSPPDKHGGLIWPITEGIVMAAGDGGAVTYLSSTPTEADPAGYVNDVQVLARRGADGGWSSKDIATPHDAPTGLSVGVGQEYRFFSGDLSNSVVMPLGSFDPLSTGASEQTPYVREDFGSGPVGVCETDCYRPLVTGCPEVGERCAKPVQALADVPAGTVFGLSGELCEVIKVCGPEARAASSDMSAVVLQSHVGLLAGHGAGLYEWVAGRLHYVSPGQPQGSEGFVWVSDGGSRVVADHIESGAAFRVVDPLTGEEAQVDAGEAGCGGCESGGGENVWVAGEGSRVFFSDPRALTEHADRGTATGDLYVCEVPAGKVACGLTDLTPQPVSGHAEVLGIVGANGDGSSVYFVANGALTEGAVKGNCPTNESQKAVVGEECNLYVVERSGSGWGQPRLVAVLSGEDRPDWNANLPVRTSRVSAGGGWLAFMSDRSLTGYDNRDAVSGRPDEEVYLYGVYGAAGDGSLVCASCDPTGGRPHGVEYGKLGPLASGVEVWPPTQWVAANVPGWTPFALERSQYQSRYLSDEGRLFFNSSDALVPQDVNGTEDVYEFEPVGVGSCTSESLTFSERSQGCVSLISSGNSSRESAFLDASANGSDVFFLTAAKLSPEDYDNSFDVYDAHECSTSAPCAPSPLVSPPPCTTADACRAAPAPQPSIFGAPPSATFNGPGNQAPSVTTTPTVVKVKKTPPKPRCKQGKKRNKRGQCVKIKRSKQAKKSRTKISLKAGNATSADGRVK